MTTEQATEVKTAEVKDMKWADLTESQKQQITGDLVSAEVVQCLSTLVSELNSVREHLTDWEDELTELSETTDYEEPAREFIRNEADLDDLEEITNENGDWDDLLDVCKLGKETWGLDNDEIEILSIEEFLDLRVTDPAERKVKEASIRESVEALVNNEDYFKWVCDRFFLEPDRDEVYEHWLVSDRASRMLKERGHPVVELMGLTVWGRGTTGQSISLDWAWNDMARELWDAEPAYYFDKSKPYYKP